MRRCLKHWQAVCNKNINSRFLKQLPLPFQVPTRDQRKNKAQPSASKVPTATSLWKWWTTYFNYISFKSELSILLPKHISINHLQCLKTKQNKRHTHTFHFSQAFGFYHQGHHHPVTRGAKRGPRWSFREPPPENINSEVLKSTTCRSGWTSQISKLHKEGKIPWPISLVSTMACALQNQIVGVKANKIKSVAADFIALFKWSGNQDAETQTQCHPARQAWIWLKKELKGAARDGAWLLLTAELQTLQQVWKAPEKA